jgi:hypothetical protein
MTAVLREPERAVGTRSDRQGEAGLGGDGELLDCRRSGTRQGEDEQAQGEREDASSYVELLSAEFQWPV